MSSSSGTDSSFTYTSPTVSKASSVSSYSTSVPRRGRALPVYASDSSDSSISRRDHRCQCQKRKERKDRREGRLRRLTKKIVMVFHHHHQPGGQEAPPLRTDRCELNHKDKSLRKHIGGMFHRTKGKEKKKNGSQTTVSVPVKKKRGGTRHMFGSAMRHFRGKRNVGVKLKEIASRVQVKEKHWCGKA
jgi:hypothetical protein